MEINKIYSECGLNTMSRMPRNFIDLTVTSPPYDKLRTYNGNINQWNEQKWKDIIQGLFRVTKQGGVVVWVVGDATQKGSETGTSFKQALWAMECGFNLHDTMIYKKSGMRYPDSLRYHAVFEYMFVFSKGQPITFNPIKDRVNIYAGEKIARPRHIRQQNGEMAPNSAYKNDRNRRISKMGCRNNVWEFSSGKENSKGKKHSATFPEALASDHIISWSNKNDLVYDPMAGSGTTLKMAIELNRNYIGSEITKEYIPDIKNRIKNAEPSLF